MMTKLIKGSSIANSWNWARCQDVIDVRDGTHDTPKYQPEGIPLVTSKNLVNGSIDFDNASLISSDDHEQIKKRSGVSRGDILMAMIGTIGNPVIVATDDEFSIKNVALFRTSASHVNTSYFYYLLQSEVIAKQFAESSRGLTQKFVSLTVLRNLKIPTPPLPEQQRIAAILAKADRLRRLRRCALEFSDTFLQSVFLQMFGDPVTNPMGWDFRPLAQILVSKPQNGLYVPKEYYVDGDDGPGVEMVHMSDLFYEIVQRGKLKRVHIPESEIEKYALDKDDLLVARRSLNFEGAAKPCRIPPSEEPLVYESSMIRITPDKAQAHPIYLYHYLSNEKARAVYVLKYVTQSTISGINQNGLKRIEILLPPTSKQREFVQYVQHYERLQSQQLETIRQAEYLFDTLLHRAFRGEL